MLTSRLFKSTATQFRMITTPSHPSREQLLARIQQLESKFNSLSIPLPPSDLPKKHSQHSNVKGPGLGPLPEVLARAPKRHVAFLFSYEGWAHSGLAYQPISNPTPLSTVEACILEALEQARLIEPTQEIDGFGCGFARCGRTDAGVSSSAQVINLWVRSTLEDPMGVKGEEEKLQEASSSSEWSLKPKVVVEIPYIAILNRFLPSSIRMLAWSPVTASFSSRYSCIWRHYKYFFSTSPSSPFLNPRFDFGESYRQLQLVAPTEEWRENLANIDWNGLVLDVPAMRDAASRFVGDHDFRNLCKIDPPKQLATHLRNISSASIDHVEGEATDMHVLNLRGGAFLYNQVRHIVALLFLVGARLETPDVIDKILWTSDSKLCLGGREMTEEEKSREVVDCKPGYEMADDLALILWQCGFNSTEFDWRIDNDPRPYDLSSSSSIPAPVDPLLPTKPPLDVTMMFTRQFLDMNRVWTEQRLKSIILKHHLASFCALAPPTPTLPSIVSKKGKVTWTPLGAGRLSRTTGYVPLLARKRGLLPEVMNSNWAEGRGKDKMVMRSENQDRSDAARVINLAKKESAREIARQEKREDLEKLNALLRSNGQLH